MTSILAHKVLQALLMLATSNICPEAEWYGDDFGPDTTYFVAQNCAVPLAPGMTHRQASTFFRAAKALAGGAK